MMTYFWSCHLIGNIKLADGRKHVRDLIPGLCRSFSEWHRQKMLPAGQLAERLSVVKVRSLQRS